MKKYKPPPPLSPGYTPPVLVTADLCNPHDVGLGGARSRSSSNSASFSRKSSHTESISPAVPMSTALDMSLIDASQDPVDETRCRNPLFIIAYLIALAGYITVAVNSFYDFFHGRTGEELEKWTVLFRQAARLILTVVSTGSIVSAIAGAVFLRTLHFSYSVVTALFVVVALSLDLAGQSLFRDHYITFMIFLPFSCLCAFITLAYRKELMLTQRLMAIAFTSAKSFWGLYVVTGVLGCMSIISQCFFYFSAVITHYVVCNNHAFDEHHEHGSHPFYLYLLWAYCALMVGWTSVLLRNISFCVTAGAVGTFWYDSIATFDTWGAWQRACGQSLGTLICGSLVMLPMDAMAFTLKALQAIVCFSPAQRRIRAWRAVLSRYSTRATVNVALHGHDWGAALHAYADYRLRRKAFGGFLWYVEACDWSSAVVQFLGAGCGILAATVVSWPIDRSDTSFIRDNIFSELVVFRLMCVLLAFFEFKMLLTLVKAATATAIQIYFEDNELIARSRPIQYSELHSVLEDMWRHSSAWMDVEDVGDDADSADGTHPLPPRYWSNTGVDPVMATATAATAIGIRSGSASVSANGGKAGRGRGLVGSVGSVGSAGIIGSVGSKSAGGRSRDHSRSNAIDIAAAMRNGNHSHTTHPHGNHAAAETGTVIYDSHGNPDFSYGSAKSEPCFPKTPAKTPLLAEAAYAHARSEEA